MRFSAARAAAAVALIAAVAACGQVPASSPPPASPAPLVAPMPVPSVTIPPPAPSTPSTPSTPTAVPAPTSPRPGVVPPASTPGELNPAVTQETIGTTICVPGWTSKVRPPVSYTDAVKRTDVALLPDPVLSHYELDHRVPLEIGGAPSDVRNLWAEGHERSGNAPQGYGSESKDRLENYVHGQVCSGRMTLAAGQAIFLGDFLAWRDAHLGVGA